MAGSQPEHVIQTYMDQWMNHMDQWMNVSMHERMHATALINDVCMKP
jgi:hypothetical protein